MKEEFSILFLLYALCFSGVVVVHAVDDFLEGDQLKGSGWLFVGLVDEEVEVVHEAYFFVFGEFLAKIDVGDEAKLVLEESTKWKLVADRLMKDAIFKFVY